MRKIISVLALLLISAACAVTAYADMGIPDKPQYMVVTNINGVYSYSSIEQVDAGQPDGSIAGGMPFYVWSTYENMLIGTTNANATSEDYDQAVCIKKSDTMSPSQSIPAETGTGSDETRYALTTEKLNVRCGPGTGFNVVKTLKNGSYVKYKYTYDTNTTWVYVKSDGAEGWVNGNYLKKTERRTRKSTNDNTVEEDTDDEEDDEDDEEVTETDAKTDQKDSDNAKSYLVLILMVSLIGGVLMAVLAVVLLMKTRR